MGSHQFSSYHPSLILVWDIGHVNLVCLASDYTVYTPLEVDGRSFHEVSFLQVCFIGLEL